MLGKRTLSNTYVMEMINPLIGSPPAVCFATFILLAFGIMEE